MKTLRITALFFVFLSFTTPLAAQSWTSELETGGVVSVDPRTNKGTVYTHQGATPLWDGTHRLHDGSVVIVKEGVVTSGGRPAPNPASRQPKVESVTPPTSSTCVELVIKACGFNGECRTEPSCSAARQLMQLEKDEAWQTRSKGPNETSLQCRQALDSGTYFKRCRQIQKSALPSACERLVTKVCGARNECDGGEVCSAAQQLLAMETQERLVSRDSERPTYTSQRCAESFDSAVFFVACDAAEAKK